MTEIEEDKKLYLEEDQSLINLMDGKNPKVLPLPWTQNKLLIRATLRSRKTFKEFSKSADRYSIILVLMGTIQVAIAIWQFFFSTQVLFNKWAQLVWLIGLGLLIFFVSKPLWEILMEYKDRDETERN